MTDPRLFSLLAIIVLIVLSALFSASEAALLAMSRLRLLQRTNDSLNKSLGGSSQNRSLSMRNSTPLIALSTVAIGNPPC